MSSGTGCTACYIISKRRVRDGKLHGTLVGLEFWGLHSNRSSHRPVSKGSDCLLMPSQLCCPLPADPVPAGVLCDLLGDSVFEDRFGWI